MTDERLGYHGRMRNCGGLGLPCGGLWIVLLACVGCTKPNPAASCANGTCSDPAYPYCDVDGAIAGEPGTCIAVNCAPGSVGACEGGNAALICNTAGNGYDQEPCAFGCDGTSLTCITKCTMHSQCTSGVCKSDGTCAMDAEILFVDPGGLASSDCSRLTPCTLDHALSTTPTTAGQTIELAAGMYNQSGPTTVSGKRHLIGHGVATTKVKNIALGPVFVVAPNAEVTLDNLTVMGARGSVGQPPMDAWGLLCPDTPVAPRMIHLIDVLFTDNGMGSNGGAIYGPCVADLRRSVFDSNTYGIDITAPTTIDRCVFSSNASVGLVMERDFAVTNSFIVRNITGAVLTGATTTAVFAFNTIVDNTIAIQCEVKASQAPINADNNIVVRNPSGIAGITQVATNCTFPSSIIGADVAPLHFKSPDTMPYDYHLTPGSNAIDVASSSMLDHDFDADSRPKGNGRDIGADEAY